MKFSVYFISLLPIIFIPNAYAQGSGKVPGASGCVYFGSTQYYCGVPFVSAEELPAECTSLFWIRVKVDDTQNVNIENPDPGCVGYIKDLIKLGKPTFLMYCREEVQDTVNALSCLSQNGGATTQTEMANLQTFVSQFPNLAGLVIGSVTFWPQTTNTDGFSANLKAYINEIKKTLPDISIGLSLVGYYIAPMFADSNSPVWLNISDLDPCVDFYYIDTYDLNDCKAALATGDAPVNGSVGYTLEQLMKQLSSLGVPKEKSYIFYSSGPSAVDTSTKMCDITTQKICASSSRNGFCIDSTQGFYQKGKFAQENAAGFIVSDPDLMDDPHGCCQCDGGPYPAFHAILAGFNGESAPAPCTLFDKT